MKKSKILPRANSLNMLTTKIILYKLSLLLLGCSASHHHKQTDAQVYQILKKAEKHVFGKSNDFTINTKYSGKKLLKVNAPEVLNESQNTKTLNLSLDQALSYATKNSREYQTQKERLYLAALSLTSTQNNFRPNISSRANTQATNQADGDIRSTANLNQSLNQNLTNGANYSLAIANDLLRYFTGDPRRSAGSVISLNILQPLIKGLGSKIAAENLTQSSRNVIYAIRDYHHYQNTFSKDIVIQYLRLMQQKESVSNQYKNYISRKENTEYLRARSVDRASPQEVSDSEQGELQAKNTWINTKSAYQSALDDFKITLGAPTNTSLNLSDNELDKLVNIGLQPIKLNEKQAFNLALKNRLPLFNAIDRFDDSKRQVAIAAEQLKTQLNFLASASIPSTGNNIGRFNFNNLSTQVGLELNLPINRINERNDYRRSLINFQSNIRSLSRTFDSLNNLMKRRIREINQFKQNYQIQRNAVKLAERRVEGNRLRFQAGTVIFRRLSESQDALISAQNAVTNALIDYQNARLQLYADIGNLNPNSTNYWLKNNPSR